MRQEIIKKLEEDESIVAYNTYSEEFEDGTEQIFEYDCDLWDKIAIDVSSEHDQNSKILKRFENLRWGGGCYRLKYEDFLVQINDTNDYMFASDLNYLLEDGFDVYDTDEKIAIATDIIETGDNKIGFDLTQIIASIKLTQEQISNFKNFIYHTNEKSTWDKVVVWDENQIILDCEKLEDECQRELYFENEDRISKDEFIELYLSENSDMFSSTEEQEEFLQDIEKLLK